VHRNAARRRADYALRGPVCVAGVEGRSDRLVRVNADHSLPPAVRAAARWWLNLPSTVLASAASAAPDGRGSG
jgi:hypothetical protein